LTCGADLSRTKIVIDREFGYIYKNWELQLRAVNHYLVPTRIPAVITTGKRLRDELQKCIGLLENYRIPKTVGC
jgi:hypothetical protein